MTNEPSTDEFSTKGIYVTGTEYTRDTTYITDRIVADPSTETASDGGDLWPVEPGRYRLIAARACPWANRSLIVRRLMGLEDAISLGIPGPTHDVRSWSFDGDEGGVDPVLKIRRLQDAYFARFSDYPRGITVPALVDLPTGAVVTNDFNQLVIDLATQWGGIQRSDAPDLYPEQHRDELAELNDFLFHNVNNGVYKCGFAGGQEAYEKPFTALFDALDTLEERLTKQRYLVGDTITLADVQLFVTLVRFDPVYHGHFKCNRNKLIEFPALWAYSRDLFQTPGFGDTIDFVHIKQHYYVTHTDVNPTQVVPLGPDLSNWLSAHGREELGGRPFGDGAAPGPVRPEEAVAPGHGVDGNGVPSAEDTAAALAANHPQD